MYLKPLTTHISESNLFQTLIYSHYKIQFILHPHLFTPGNPMLQTLTFTLGCKPLTLPPNPKLKRRHTLFSLMLLVLFFSSHSQVQFISNPYLFKLGNPIYIRPICTYIRESNLFQMFIYSHHGI